MDRTELRAGFDPGRRRVLALGIGLFVTAAIPFRVGARDPVWRRRVSVMGTLADLAVVHRDVRIAHLAMDAAVAELRRVERVMSRFLESSDVGRANLAARGTTTVIERDTAHVLEEALAWAWISDGRFDPCCGKAVALWDVERRAEPPPAPALWRLAGRRLYRFLDLDLDARGAAVRLTDPDVALDLGGIAKGHAVDCAVAALRAAGIERGLVNAGGDLYALGRSGDGDPWRVGIRSPEYPFGVSGTVSLADAAVATSGDYVRFFAHRGRRYHHLLDPDTARPRRGSLHTVTVQADTCMVADAAATTAFGMVPAAAESLLARRVPRARIVDAR